MAAVFDAAAAWRFAPTIGLVLKLAALTSAGGWYSAATHRSSCCALLDGRSRIVFKVVKMESPHEHQQNLLLSRIINNVEKLNEAIVVMNKSLQDINIQNMNVELVAQMFKNYQSNVLFHLEATDNLKPPS
ncbi:hypothetical protein G3M48_007902 [Beauveria asiatica]|uniref:DASH complex subunit DAD4 n=1 Tax=Beauveria asiatica TaxID=1069075 RepID=A0AAW0RLC3_9HYPO